MPIFAFSYGLRRVTLQCPYVSTMFSKYKYLIVNLVFSHLVFGVGSQKGLLADIEWAPYDFHFKFTDTLRFPSDLRTVLIQGISESHGKKTDDGRMNFFLTYTVTNVVAHDHLRCLEIGGKIADRKIVR